MTTRLEHERAANIVSILFHPRAALHDGVTFRPWQSICHDTERLAARMYLYGRDRTTDFHGRATEANNET